MHESQSNFSRMVKYFWPLIFNKTMNASLLMLLKKKKTVSQKGSACVTKTEQNNIHVI